MRIGELSKRSGLAPSRIRFYESIGLLKTVDRRANGYRTYTPDALLVLQIIARAQKAGFSLDEIRAILPGDLAHWDRGPLLEALRTKIADIEAMQTQLAQSHAQLSALVSEIEAQPEDSDCSANVERFLADIQEDAVAS